MSRFRQGLELAGVSWRTIRADRSLAAFPVLGGISAVALTAAFVIPGLILVADDSAGTGLLVAGIVLFAIAAYLAAFAGIFVLRAAGRSLAMVLIALKRPEAGFVGTCITAGLTLTVGPFLVAQAGLAGAVAAFAGNAAIMVVVLAFGLRGCPIEEKLVFEPNAERL